MIDRINGASLAGAIDLLLDCCASRRWAEAVAARRPFADAGALFEAAESVWWSLEAGDWEEALVAHPRIGERPVDRTTRSSRWSAEEQAEAVTADRATLDELEACNRAYEAKFGRTYVVFATGKSAAEMLAICRRRLANDPADELRVAAEEQRKITAVRLEKLLADQPSRRVTSHVLDTSRGRPAAGISVTLERRDGDEWRRVGAGATDADGRTGELVVDPGDYRAGTYRLLFATEELFDDPAPFYPEVAVSFRISDTAQHYHVPLLLSPFGYTTYRGS